MVIVITGASSGIGFELGQYLHEKGHRVYGLSRRKVVADFHQIETDITEKTSVENAINQISIREKGIDILINNAGRGMVGAVEDGTKEEILDLFGLNLVGVMQMTSAVLPLMRQLKGGKIINISSIGSVFGLPFRGFYSASKSALDRLTESLRYELKPSHIQVCSLHLGDIKTDIADHRIQSKVSSVYSDIFKKVHQNANEHVAQGTSPREVAVFINRLIHKRHLRAHYLFGKWGQKMGVYLRNLLPYAWFERLMAKYSGI